MVLYIYKSIENNNHNIHVLLTFVGLKNRNTCALQSQAPVMKNNIPFMYLNEKQLQGTRCSNFNFVEATGLISFNLIIFSPETLQQKHICLAVDLSAVNIQCCYLHVIDVRCP